MLLEQLLPQYIVNLGPSDCTALIRRRVTVDSFIYERGVKRKYRKLDGNVLMFIFVSSI